MKITDLEQYMNLQNEISMLEERIDKYRAKEKEIVADTAKDYRSGYGHNITIRGYSREAYSKIIKAQVLRAERKKQLESKALEIEKFIGTVGNSEIRQIIQLKYLDGQPWKIVSRKIYGYPCEDRARKRITRFFAEN